MQKNVFIWHLKNCDDMYILLNYWWNVGLLILYDFVFFNFYQRILRVSSYFNDFFKYYVFGTPETKGQTDIDTPKELNSNEQKSIKIY